MEMPVEQYEKVLEYVHHCKYINKYKLVNRFDLSSEEAYETIDMLLENGEITPTDNFDFRVLGIIFDGHE